MRMIKQKPGSNECAACVVAMLTDRTKDEILASVSDPEKPDYFWLRFMRTLGFSLEDVRNDRDFDTGFAWKGMFNGYLMLPTGNRYYCSVRVAKGEHALAVDESGMVFDPSTSAPMVGTCTLAQYLRFNQAKFHTIVIGCCYRVREVDQAGEGNPSWF